MLASLFGPGVGKVDTEGPYVTYEETSAATVEMLKVL